MAVPVFDIIFKCLMNNFVLLHIWDSYGEKRNILFGLFVLSDGNKKAS